jgi:hypothetical protein
MTSSCAWFKFSFVFGSGHAKRSASSVEVTLLQNLESLSEVYLLYIVYCPTFQKFPLNLFQLSKIKCGPTVFKPAILKECENCKWNNTQLYCTRHHSTFTCHYSLTPGRKRLGRLNCILT